MDALVGEYILPTHPSILWVGPYIYSGNIIAPVIILLGFY